MTMRTKECVTASHNIIFSCMDGTSCESSSFSGYYTMAEGNGDASAERTPDYQKLIDHGLNEKVAAKLDEIYKTGELFSVACGNRPGCDHHFLSM